MYSGSRLDDNDPDPRGIVTRRDFARTLTLARERAGLTVRDVARAAGLPDGTAGDYFAGRHVPPQTRLPSILRACGVIGEEITGQWLDALRRVRRSPGRRSANRPVPYRGLASFQPDDAEWFFGREALTSTLLARLLERRHEEGILAVVGPSGSGKSSLLRAGLIPALRRTADREKAPWPALLFTPGRDPVGELAAGLAGLTGASAQETIATLRGDPGRAAALARQALSSAMPGDEPAKDGRLILVIDQFEEVFTGGCGEAELHAFVTALRAVTAADAGDPPALVVIGLRADFYARALRYRELAEILQTSQIVVGPMSETELRNAIVAPAQKAEVELEDGLADLLLRELSPSVGDPQRGEAHDAGALPLLSHALLATWERRHQGKLTIADYRDSGGINGAVARTAEQVYAGLSDAQQRVARQVFLRLVHIANDTGDTRRRVEHRELPTGDDATTVIDSFVEHRMITATAHEFEIVHEALLLAWPRLRGWLDTDRAGLRTHRRLTEAAETWRDSGRDTNTLLRGLRLAEIAEWAEDPRHAADLNGLERDFLAASDAQQLAEARATRLRGRRRQQVIAALTLLSLATTLLSAIALRQQSRANEQRDLAVSRRVAIEADKLRSKDVALAGQLSLAAYHVARTPEARSSLLESYAAPSATRIIGSAGVMQTVAVTRDGHLIATGGADHGVRLWNVADRGHPSALGRPLRGHRDTVYSVAFSPDGRLLASGGGDKAVFLWRLNGASAEGRRLSGPRSTVYSVAFSPDGRTLAAGSADETVHLWDVSDGARPEPLGRPLSGPHGFVQSVAFSPDGRTLAAGSADRTVRLWDLADRAEPKPAGRPLIGFAKTVFSVAFSPDGRTLAAGSADGTVRLWDTTDRSHAAGRGEPLTGPTSWVNSVAFSPDGQNLAAAGSDGKAWMWETATHAATAPLPHPGPVTAVMFSGAGSLATSAADGVARIWDVPGPIISGPDGGIFSATFGASDHVLALVGAGNTARLWNIADPHRPRPLGPEIRNATRAGPASGAGALSPDAKTLAIGGVDGSTQLWDVRRPARPVPLPARLTGPSKVVEGITFSPDGRLVAVAGNDGTAWLWDVTEPRRPVRTSPPLTGPANYAYAPAFSWDGRTLALGSADRAIYLWDITDQRHPAPLTRPLTGHSSYVFTVAFRPDDRVLASAGADDKVLLWDIRDRHRPRSFLRPATGPGNYVFSLTFDRTGDMLAAAAGDGTVWIWDVSDPRRPRTLATLTGSSEAVYTDAFAMSRPLLVTAGVGRSVRLWNTDATQVAAYVCAVTGSPITRAEWNRYLPEYRFRPPCR